ncbi:MAG: hypothetical protein RSG23_08650 [Gordonibacter sp.]|uniref:hypothetical protein n=1 Tax=Gordonibacter sp. TaxID=1968902 RepID=UPI002FC95826
MSGVVERNRSLSRLEFYQNALALRVEVNRIMVNEKIVPKRYRLTNAVPTIETARSVVVNVNTANAFFPNTAHNVLMRKHYMTLAIADCEQLKLDLMCMIELGFVDSVNRLERVVEMVEREIALLKGARKNVKLVGKDVDRRIEDMRAELDRLQDIKADEAREAEDGLQ